MIIFHHYLNKVENVLLHHLLNDQNHTQIVSPGKKKLIQPHALKQEQLICVLKGGKHELTFSNFLTIKKLELDFTNVFKLTMHGKNNQH